MAEKHQVYFDAIITVTTAGYTFSTTVHGHQFKAGITLFHRECGENVDIN